jgi:hypothetical protein
MSSGSWGAEVDALASQLPALPPANGNLGTALILLPTID